VAVLIIPDEPERTSTTIRIVGRISPGQAKTTASPTTTVDWQTASARMQDWQLITLVSRRPMPIDGNPWEPRSTSTPWQRALQELIDGAALIVAPAGRQLLGHDRPGQALAVIKGVVRVFTWTTSGHRVTTGYARPGDLVGVNSVLSGSDNHGAEALNDATLAVLSLESLRNLVIRRPELGWALAEHLAEQAVDATRRLVDGTVRPATARVARHLLELAEHSSDEGIVVRISHRRLADAVGTAREVVTRALGELRGNGIIETDLRLIRVLDRDALARAADAVR
jgi:CRP/FNR family cyclic AMP-dependent transcriptional regulator